MRKTPSGKYLVEFRKGRDPDHPHARSRSFDTREEAERYKLSLPDRRKAKGGVSISFSELANAYTLAKAANMSESDQMNNYWKMDRIIFPRIGDLPAMSITHSQLDKYVAERMRDYVYIYMGKDKPRKRTSKRVGLSTIHRELSIIRAILNWGVKRQLITSSPMAGYEMPRRDDKQILPPTVEEYELILQHAAPHCKRFILLSYYTGLRPGKVEAFGLKWENVDLDEGVIQIISAEKGGIPLRKIALHDTLLSAMREWKKEDEAAGYVGGYIIHYKFKQVTSSMKKAWAGAKRRAGITRPLRPYSLRHKTASDLLEASGGDVKVAAEILGNDPETLMRHYQMVNNEKKAALVKGLK